MITSTTPVTALISTKGQNTALTTIHLDGTTDWMLARQSLLAWTGRTLTIRPTANFKMNMAQWGSSEVTGRGLLALVGQGSISEISLRDGESYIIHPSSVIAHTINSQRPLPYRLKSSSFRLQVPRLSTGMLSDTKFATILRESSLWQTTMGIIFKTRTWVRRIIWADRVFLQFQGPTTILLQTRTSSRKEMLTASEVNEMADVQAGAIRTLFEPGKQQKKTASADETLKEVKPIAAKLPTMQTASIGGDGKVIFEATEGAASSR